MSRIASFLICGLILATSGLADAVAFAEQPGTKTSFKGWELYIWQEGGDICFSLLSGTNRLKNNDEIIKASVKGIDAIRPKLDELKAEEEVFIYGKDPEGRMPPPKDQAKLIVEYGAKIGLKVQVMTVQSSATTEQTSPSELIRNGDKTQVASGAESEEKIGVGTAIPRLQQAIEKRFGRPDSIVGEENCLLNYRLKNGDTLTLVLADEKVVGIEHSKKIDLSKVVGKKVTLVGVYNGIAKGRDFIMMADGNDFRLKGRNKVSDNGKLVSVTGVLEYFPGTNGPDNVQGIPPHYYMESKSVEIKALYPFKFVKRRPVKESQ